MNEYDAKTLSINDAKRNALEQAGTYLESHTTVLNYQLVKDEIITFSAGLLKVKVINEERTLVNNMFAFKVYIEATIDIKLLDDRLNEIRRDSNLRQQLEKERERVKQLEAKIADIYSSSTIASKQEVKNVINELAASEWIIKGYNIKDYNLQIDCFTRAIELDSQYAIAYYNRGFIYDALGKHETAIKDYTKAIELDPQFTEAYNNRGLSYYSLWYWGGQTNESYKIIAINDYNKIIELNPRCVATYVIRGNIYYDLQRYETAIQDYTKAIEMDPENATAYCNRGLAYNGLDKYELSIKDFGEAIRLNNQYAKAYWKRGVAIFLISGGSISKIETAIIDCDKAIELNPQLGEAYRNRGSFYLGISNYKAAANDYNSYLKICGNKIGDAEKVRQWIRDLGYTPQY